MDPVIEGLLNLAAIVIVIGGFVLLLLKKLKPARDIPVWIGLLIAIDIALAKWGLVIAWGLMLALYLLFFIERGEKAP